jgi:PKD repeat protein
MQAIRSIHMRMAVCRDGSGVRRGRAATASALGLAVLVLSVWAAPSGAVVAKVGRHIYGLTPIRGVNPAALPSVQRALRESGRSATGPIPYDKAGQLGYHGGPVMHSVNTHVIYWDPGGEFTATTKNIVNKFFTDLAHDSGLPNNVMGIAGQYGDGAGHAVYSSTFEGEATDATAYPASGCTIPNEFDKSAFYAHCITDEQLQTRLSAYVAAHSLPKGPAQQYFVLFPHNVVTCLPEEEVEVEPGVFEIVHPCSNNFYCAYHSSIEPGTANEIIYSDIPFSLLDTVEHAKACQADGHKTEIQHPNGDTTGGGETTKFADVALKYTSHEYTEAATDPLGTAWFDSHGQENGDKCNFAGSGPGLGEDPNAFLPTLGGSASPTLYDQLINGDHFYIQSEWDNVAKACLMKPVALSAASFAASPTSGVVGSPVKFSGAVTDPYGGPGLTWKFGDGTESSGANPEHVYAAEGSYEVTMTPKDDFTGSTTTPVVHTFVVDELPKAAFSFEPNPAEEGKAVKFKPTGSEDPDGTIAGYVWKFGDGTESGVEAPEHIYAAPGSYTVTLTVTDSASQKGTTTHSVTINGVPAVVTGAASGLGPSSATLNATVNPNGANVALVPNSNFAALAATAKNGEITLRLSLSDPGTFSWLLTFQNGKFGVFAASTSKCKRGYVRLNGRCRPSKIVYAKGSKTFLSGGVVTFTIKPTRSALTALKNALKRRKGLPVTITLTFQSSRGGSPVSQTRTLTVKLKKR